MIGRSRVRWWGWVLLLASEGHASSSFMQKACASAALSATGARCGTVEVAEDPAKPERKIPLNVVILPALHPKRGVPPLFHVEGGPGIPGTEAAEFYADAGRAYREEREVVLFDQRGTGHSNALHCPAIEKRSPLVNEFPVDDLRACRRDLEARASLANYSTTRAAEDIDAIREALHAEQIDIWSISYGTRLTQAYLKQFPTRVRRAVLTGFAPLDYKTPLYHALNAQRVVDLLIYKCRADQACSRKYPNLPQEWAAVLARFDKADVAMRGDGGTLSVSHGRFVESVRNTMDTAAGQRGFPAMVHAAFGGDYGPFLRTVRKGSSPFAMGLYLTIACSEGGARIHEGDVERLTSGTFLGESRVREELAACKEWPRYEVAKEFFDPPATVPELLVITGEMDHVMPPDYAEAFCAKLDRCRLVIVPDLGHAAMDLDRWNGGECFDALTVKFFGTGSVESTCVAKMRAPAFQ